MEMMIAVIKKKSKKSKGFFIPPPKMSYLILFTAFSARCFIRSVNLCFKPSPCRSIIYTDYPTIT